MAIALGIPEGFRFLSSSDPTELMLLRTLLERVAENTKNLHDHQAVKIAERVGQLFSDK